MPWESTAIPKLAPRNFRHHISAAEQESVRSVKMQLDFSRVRAWCKCEIALEFPLIAAIDNVNARIHSRELHPRYFTIKTL